MGTPLETAKSAERHAGTCFFQVGGGSHEGQVTSYVNDPKLS
jgi:hypothetical protein